MVYPEIPAIPDLPQNNRNPPASVTPAADTRVKAAYTAIVMLFILTKGLFVLFFTTS